jgi:putative chitinase
LIKVDGAVLLDIAPRLSGAKAKRQKAICDALHEVLAQTLERYAIDTHVRIGHFLAQACHESDGFCTTEEYASGAAYEGRADLGNTQKGDGRRFKGRGLFQLTGRANYSSYGRAIGLDLIANPEAAADPETSLRIACEYWKRKKLNQFADKNDLVIITKRINGGLNGIESRRTYLTKAKWALARLCAAGAKTQDLSPAPVLRLKDKKADGVAGPETSTAPSPDRAD